MQLEATYFAARRLDLFTEGIKFFDGVLHVGRAARMRGTGTRCVFELRGVVAAIVFDKILGQLDVAFFEIEMLCNLPFTNGDDPRIGSAETPLRRKESVLADLRPAVPGRAGPRASGRAGCEGCAGWRRRQDPWP